MIIRINEAGKVVSLMQGSAFEHLEPDHKKTFRVKEIPSVKPDEELYLDARSMTFHVEKRQKPVEKKQSRERLAEIQEAQNAKKQALQWLSDNDWRVNKVMLGEWTEDDARWRAYLEDRRSVRERLDQADAILKTSKKMEE